MWRTKALTAFAVSALLLGACKGERRQPAGSESSRPAQTSKKAGAGQDSPAPRAIDDGCTIELRPLRSEAPGRLIAIGDVHGDLEATRRALRLGGAIDASDHWLGGNLTVVQTGDVLDRGDDEREILELLERLAREAEEAGGRIVRLNGNHELMNAMGDFRYVTRGGFQDFVEDPAAESAGETGRARAFLPGGSYANKLADNDLVTIVGKSVFVHGGVTPRFAEGLERANRDARCFLRGERARPPDAVLDPDGPLWSRAFSQGDGSCELLKASLEALGVERMVVGHTPQLGGITSACDDRIWRIDTGMAQHYRGPTEVLEISDQQVRILK